MSGKLTSLAPYVALCAAAAWLYRDAGAFAAAARPGQLGPDFWPRAILVLLIVVCVCELVRRLLFERTASDKPQASHTSSVDDAQLASDDRFAWCLAGGIGLTIAYVLALDWLGFFVATALYLALFMAVGRYRRVRVIVSASVLGSLAFVYVFMKIVYVSLPLGRGPFKALSVWLLALLGVR
ncbi:MAG TPA: tripartite tricarboxylate transporter TctB family protein [Casimicrobiaceae bacterium]|nr:tripartite tricarboxylate transporter TctB family protein [Casimicrobiaceae bacterium]